MKLLDKIKTRHWEKCIKTNIMAFYRYEFNIYLKSGEVINCMTNRYHAINCSIGEYLLIGREGVNIEKNFYPKESIERIEEVFKYRELVYCDELSVGILGLTENYIKENQSIYREYLDRYTEEENCGRE